MTERIQELIDKIKNEGIQAETKAQDIEAQAHKRAEGIIAQAQKEAARIVSEAKIESQKTKDVVEAALKQSSRDMLLRLRKEITKILESIVLQDLRESLSPEVVAGLIQKIAVAYLNNNMQGGDIRVALSGGDLKTLENGFLAKLKSAVKQPLVLRSADNIRGGFTISFDQGKSCFDFTDESLAEFLSQYLNEHVAQILKEALTK